MIVVVIVVKCKEKEMIKIGKFERGKCQRLVEIIKRFGFLIFNNKCGNQEL